MHRPYNFSAGPAALPDEVLAQAASEMLDWHGSGLSVMEMSHRSKEFIAIHEQAMADLRELLAIPNEFRILFMQGGGIAENAIVPLNLSRGQKADFVVTGGDMHIAILPRFLLRLLAPAASDHKIRFLAARQIERNYRVFGNATALHEQDAEFVRDLQQGVHRHP